MASDAGAGRLRLALLIDGENIGAALAGEIFRLAAKEGALPIRRVYGDTAQMKDWAEVPGLRQVHAGTGKNATDLLLCIEAMEFIHSRQVDGLLLAASDRDYAHLALHLRERGFFCMVLGEEKTPQRLRQAAARFVLLGKTVTAAPFEGKLRETIGALAGVDGWAAIGPLGTAMWQRHQVRREATGCSGWGRFLALRPAVYEVDAAARPPKVRVRGSAFLP